MKTFYVNPSAGKDYNSGSANAPFKTLTHALEQATVGSIIRLASKTYNTSTGEVFPLIIPGGVIVLGNEASKGRGILIFGNGEYQSPTFSRQNVTIVLENGAQLLGVTVTNSVAKGTGVWLESTSAIIANNTFTNCGREGIFVTGTSKPVIRDNRFVQNAASGIFLVRNSKGEVRNNVYQSTGYGITVSDYAAPLLTDNQLTNNRVGIQLLRNAKPVIRRNLMAQNSEGGLVISGNAQPDFGQPQDPAGNILRDNFGFDLRNETSQTLISVGNQLNPTKAQGLIKFTAAEVTVAAMGPRQFSDVSDHWAINFIESLVSRGLISGFPDGTFRPENSLTRAEYAALLAKSFDLPRKVGAASGNFKDISSNFWAAPAITKATAMGFISGFPDGTFRPQDNLTRVQALLSLVSGLGLTGGNSSVLLAFRDRAQIPSYATNAIATATQRQLVVNYPQSDLLEPLRDITRAEIAAKLYQALVTTGTAVAVASPYIVAPQTHTTSFSDIQGHWAAEFIHRLSDIDLVSGFLNGTFQPDSPLNRAQYAALLVKALEPIAIRPATQFIDIDSDFWASSVIQQAYRSGFISGFPDSTFHPGQNLRRIHLIVSLASGLALPAADEAILNIYTDQNTIPNYARPAVAAATQAKIVVSYPNPRQISSLEETTRAAATAMVYQALVHKGKVSAINSPYIVG